MQKVSNDIRTNAEQTSSLNATTDAIKHTELGNIVNFTRRNLNNIMIIKKDGTKEKYNVQKVVDAITKSATRMLVKFSDKEIKDICAYVNKSVLDMDSDNVEILLTVDSNKWEDTEIFRFYRTTGSVGELYVRDFQAKVSDTKADRGICFTAGVYTEEGRKYAEGRPIDLIQKDGLIKLLKKVDSI